MAMIPFPSLFGNRGSNSSSIFDPFSWGFPIPFPSLSTRSPETLSFTGARIDWKEMPDDHGFTADLPGLKKEEVEEGRLLQISGERKVEEEDKNETWHRVERRSSKFMRRFRLPVNAKMEDIKGAIENGLLTVTVAKAEIKKRDVKAIEISG